jgi:hypothetical protein
MHTPRNLEYVLHNVTILAGLRHKLTFEMLRWTSAVRSLQGGMDDDRLRRRLGLSHMAWRRPCPSSSNWPKAHFCGPVHFSGHAHYEWARPL